MFDHIGLRVSDLKASVTLYSQLLDALGFELVANGADYAGFGPPGAAGFWLYERHGAAGPGTHVAFVAKNRRAVDAFHAAGLNAGAHDNGPPGLRPDYSQDYYAAFLVDRDGNNLEAVCLTPLDPDRGQHC
jgi:catechol 2,3-dioxygenase-like lactoylglutathione lyase family enzyme